MTSFDIERLPFTQEHLRSWQADDRRFINWPVVYILDDGKRAYVGETLNTAARMRQHLESAERKTLKAVRLVLDDTFNKSGPSLAVHHDDLREQTAQDARVRGFVALRAIGCGIENDAGRPPADRPGGEAVQALAPGDDQQLASDPSPEGHGETGRRSGPARLTSLRCRDELH